MGYSFEISSEGPSNLLGRFLHLLEFRWAIDMPPVVV
jgi:hypothetical protein